VKAERPLIYAGQGVHYARAWTELRQLAELLEAPVVTSLPGKSSFPENHPLSLGSGGRTVPKPVHHFLQNADIVFGVGCSFARTNYGISVPAGKVIIHSTIDPVDLNKDVRADYGLIGDAKLTIQLLIDEIKSIWGEKKRGTNGGVAEEIKRIKTDWLAEWMSKLTSDEIPLSPYRVLWELMHTIDRENTIITADAGSPRDQFSPFWETIAPLTYIGWGKSTQLGYGLGLVMGAKLAEPDKLCINVMGDAAIGMTGMDFETAVRAGIPILTIVLKNLTMAIELKSFPTAVEKYSSADLGGNYAEMAKAFGGYGEQVVQPQDIVPAIKRAVQKTQDGIPALLEFITAKETQYSLF
jgi:acetolactate synthase-1/2/3 large subunit